MDIFKSVTNQCPTLGRITSFIGKVWHNKTRIVLTSFAVFVGLVFISIFFSPFKRD